MGSTSYSSSSRSSRSINLGYSSKSKEEIFTQQKVHRVHDGKVKTFNTYPEFLNELRRLLGLVNVYYSYSPYSQKIKKLDV